MQVDGVRTSVRSPPGSHGKAQYSTTFYMFVTLLPVLLVSLALSLPNAVAYGSCGSDLACTSHVSKTNVLTHPRAQSCGVALKTRHIFRICSCQGN